MGGSSFSVIVFFKKLFGGGSLRQFHDLCFEKKRGYLRSKPLLVIHGVITSTSGVITLLVLPTGVQGPLCKMHHFFPS